MHVSGLLSGKGRPKVITIGPEETMEAAARLLHDKHIGALIVRGDDGAVAGVLSERDIARGIAVSGAASLTMAGRHLTTCWDSCGSFRKSMMKLRRGRL